MWRNTSDRYGLSSILLHWTIALLFAVEIGVGFAMVRLDTHPAFQFRLYQWHKSAGFLVLALALARIAWSLASITPAPVSQLASFARRAAGLVKCLLYGATVAVPLAGWAIASASPLRIPSFAFNLVVVPNLPLPVSDTWERDFSRLHAVLAYTAGGVVLVHAAAALWHHVWRRDETLRRVLGMRRPANPDG
jgi:cytochrome b561